MTYYEHLGTCNEKSAITKTWTYPRYKRDSSSHLCPTGVTASTSPIKDGGHSEQEVNVVESVFQAKRDSKKKPKQLKE